MTHYMIDFLTGFGPEWGTFLLAMTPVGELRASIPLGLTTFNLRLPIVLLLSVVGNMIPPILIVLFLEPLAMWLSKRSNTAKRFFDWLFERTRRKFYGKHEKWGDRGLVAFVAVPLPVTGAWTGSIAAFLFGIKPVKAIPLIFLGVVIASVIVTLASLGIISLV